MTGWTIEFPNSDHVIDEFHSFNARRHRDPEYTDELDEKTNRREIYNLITEFPYDETCQMYHGSKPVYNLVWVKPVKSNEDEDNDFSGFETCMLDQYYVLSVNNVYEFNTYDLFKMLAFSTTLYIYHYCMNHNLFMEKFNNIIMREYNISGSSESFDTFIQWDIIKNNSLEIFNLALQNGYRMSVKSILNILLHCRNIIIIETIHRTITKNDTYLHRYDYEPCVLCGHAICNNDQHHYYLFNTYIPVKQVNTILIRLIDTKQIDKVAFLVNLNVFPKYINMAINKYMIGKNPTDLSDELVDDMRSIVLNSNLNTKNYDNILDIVNDYDDELFFTTLNDLFSNNIKYMLSGVICHDSYIEKIRRYVRTYAIHVDIEKLIEEAPRKEKPQILYNRPALPALIRLRRPNQQFRYNVAFYVPQP